jgi:crossover junction endodeoxyribonuclease RusA
MTVIDLPYDKPPMTKNKVRRMHYQAEAKLRRDVVEQVRWAIKASRVKPMVGAIVVLHWRVETKRRQDGDGADPFKAACIDALVLEGILPDDSWVHVVHSGVTCHPPIPGRPGALWLTLTDPDVEVA